MCCNKHYLIAYVCILAACTHSNAADARQPNVVVILTDDQGWGDLSVNGNTNLSTPNIDSLARDGATLENFYVCRYAPRQGPSFSRADIIREQE